MPAIKQPLGRTAAPSPLAGTTLRPGNYHHHPGGSDCLSEQGNSHLQKCRFSEIQHVPSHSPDISFARSEDERHTQEYS